MLMLIGMVFLFLSSIQPMMMVVSLIFITLLYSLEIMSIMSGYWFGYVLVLVMLSGVLVVFTYMVSLVPNESFEMYSLIFIIVMMMMFLKIGGFMYDSEWNFVSLNLWMSYIGVFNVFLISFLLGIMVMVVWLSCMEEGAIRVNIYKYAWLKD